MMRSILHLLCIAAIACSPAMAAEIYRTTDDEGNVVFTDDPPTDDAEPVELDPLTTVPATEVEEGDDPDAATSSASEPSTSDQAQSGITGLRITYPPDDEGVRHNGGRVPFRVALEPEGTALPGGYEIEIVLDGEPRARGASREMVIAPVNRGAHTVRARLLDPDGTVRLRSEPVKFFLLRKALGGSN